MSTNEAEDIEFTSPRPKQNDFKLHVIIGLIALLFGVIILDHIGLAAIFILRSPNSNQENPSVACTTCNKPPKNIIVMIADGFGPASQSFARLAKKMQLPLDSILVGTSRTSSSDKIITDSAAGATAFSCGLKTINYGIGIDPSIKPCGTILEAAALQNKRTGIVATKKVTDATPAAFSSHAARRSMENEIAEQQIYKVAQWLGLKKGYLLDVIMGGGQCEFIPNSVSGSCRGDSINLIQEAKNRNYTYVTNRQELNRPLQLPVLGLFAQKHLKYVIDKQTNDPEPSLMEMASKAIDLLNHDNPNGFFLMIEGSKIDTAGHENDAAAHYHEILAYNEVVQYVLNFAQKDRNTLVVSTADHETGGLVIGRYGEFDTPKFDSILQMKKSSSGIVAEYNAQGASADINAIFNNAGLSNPTSAELEYFRNAANKLLAVGKIVSDRSKVSFSTEQHSAVDVNVYAYGPYSPLFAGNQENNEIGQKLALIMNVNLAPITQTLIAKTSK